MDKHRVGDREYFHPGWRPRADAYSGWTPCAGAAQPVHLWTMNVLELPTDRRLALLSDAERARARRYADPRRRAQYLGGRIGLRLLLTAYSGLANSALRFGAVGRGKPILRNQFARGELGFNYSLAGAYGLYALAWNRRVGVDLEMLSRRFDAARLARHKLTRREARAWRSLPKSRQTSAMLKCWTRKEAFGKAQGYGIRYALNQAEVFARPESAYWRSAECGLRDLAADAEPCAARAPREIHGIQLQMPFAAAAALAYDGAALAADANPAVLPGWQLVSSPRAALNS